MSEYSQELLRYDLNKLVATPEGARVLRWIIYEAGALEDPSWASDPLLMALKEGKRVLARDISNMIRKVDEEFATGGKLYRKIFETRMERVSHEVELPNAGSK